jgi:hypothetical protein
LLQSVSYTAGAISVVLGVIYYAINLREQTRNRRVSLASSLLSSLGSKEGTRDYYELMSMQWTDFDDFYRKYDSSVNPENYIKRAHWFGICEHVGWQYRQGLVDLDTINVAGGFNIATIWRKFKPIYDEYLKLEGFTFLHTDYLVEAIWKKYWEQNPENVVKQRLMSETAFKHEDATRENENKQ